MTARAERAVEEAVALGEPEPGPSGQERARASRVTRLPFAPPEGSPLGHARSQAAKAAAAAGKVLRARADRSPVHWQPPPIAKAWQGHREAAAAWNAAVARGCRLTYGAAHTAVVAAVYVVLAVTATPAGLLLLAAMVVSCWFWL